MSYNEQIYLLRHESWWNILYYCGFFGIIFWKDVEEVKNRSRKKGVYCQLQQQKKQQQQPPHSKMHIFFSAGFNALLNSLDRCLEKGPSRSILFFVFFWHWDYFSSHHHQLLALGLFNPWKTKNIVLEIEFHKLIKISAFLYLRM